MNKYQNKYRIPSARLQNWDYGAKGAYFVTICTQNREHFFGEIVETHWNVETHCNASLHSNASNQSINEMILTDLGKKVEEEWLKTIALRPDMHLELGNFVVMPNHFHAIIIIGENEFNSGSKLDSRVDSPVDLRADLRCRDAMHRVSTHNVSHNVSDNVSDTDTHNITDAVTITANKFGPQSKNLASIIRGFKSAVTAYSRKNATHGVSTTNFGWQSRYHDHIIRNSFEFERIQNYIANNIDNWNKDKFHEKK